MWLNNLPHLRVSLFSAGAAPSRGRGCEPGMVGSVQCGGSWEPRSIQEGRGWAVLAKAYTVPKWSWRPAAGRRWQWTLQQVQIACPLQVCVRVAPAARPACTQGSAPLCCTVASLTALGPGSQVTAAWAVCRGSDFLILCFGMPLISCATSSLSSGKCVCLLRASASHLPL